MMRKNPLVPVALALMVGIIAAGAFSLWPDSWLWAMVACALLLGLSLLIFKQARLVSLLLAVVFFGLVGGLLASLRWQSDWTTRLRTQQAVAPQSGRPAKSFMEVRLTETPVPREKSWRAKATVLHPSVLWTAPLKGGQHTAGGDITLFLRRDITAATLRYGDRLAFHGYPDPEQRYIYLTSDHYIITERDSTSLRSRCETLRLKLLHRMQRGPLASPQAGVAEALALGWRGDLDPKTQSSFRDAGIAHLLAVSGLHVGLLAALVSGLLFWVNKERSGRIIRGSIQLIAVWGFALLTGMTPSAVRAALMFSLFIVSYITARRTPSLNLLAAAAIITLVSNPMLIYDLGWQLSYSAVAGILLARPVVTAFRNRLWHLTAVSTFATLATLPVMTTTFRRLPVYFLVANIIIVPLAGLMLFLSLVYMAVPCELTAWPLHWLIAASQWLTAWVAALPGAVVEIP